MAWWGQTSQHDQALSSHAQSEWYRSGSESHGMHRNTQALCPRAINWTRTRNTNRVFKKGKAFQRKWEWAIIPVAMVIY